MENADDVDTAVSPCQPAVFAVQPQEKKSTEEGGCWKMIRSHKVLRIATLTRG